MTTGFYLAAIVGSIVSFLTGCIWYTFIVGSSWQKEMGFSNERIKIIFTPKKMFLAFICEWIASFCLVGIFYNLDVTLLIKVTMLTSVIIFSGIKLSIFDGKTLKVILINEGYRFISIVILATTFTVFM